MNPTEFSLNDSGETIEPEERIEHPGAAVSPSPGHAAEPEHEALLLDEMRARILNRLLTAAGGLGLLVYLADLPLLVRSSQWMIIATATLVITALLWAAIDRRLAYRLRVGLLLAGLLAAGLSTLVSDGLLGSGRVFLVTLPFIAAIFASGRGRIAWAMVSVGVLALTGVAMMLGWIDAPGLRPGSGNSSLLSWVVATANFSLLVISGTASLGLLIEGLETSLKQQKSLAQELVIQRELLEMRVQARTQDLERRVVQIHTAAEITGAINRVISVGGVGIDQLLFQVCELVRDRFNLYYVGIFLIETGRSGYQSPGDEPGGYAVLKAGTGDAGREMLAAGHRLAIGGDSMIGWACANKQARIALDVGAEAVRFNNPFLQRTRSELALPIVAGQTANSGDLRALGALTIQSTQEAAFDQDDITALQGIADNLASAILNARMFATLQASLEEVESLHRHYIEGAWNQEAAVRDLSYTFQAGGNGVAGDFAANITGQESGPPALEVPIQLRNQVIGELILEADADASAAPREWTADDLALIQAVTDQAALALETARLLEETQRAAESERTAADITNKLWATSDMETILTTTLRELAASLDVRDGSIELWPSKPQPAVKPLEDSDASA